MSIALYDVFNLNIKFGTKSIKLRGTVSSASLTDRDTKLKSVAYGLLDLDQDVLAARVLGNWIMDHFQGKLQTAFRENVHVPNICVSLSGLVTLIPDANEDHLSEILTAIGYNVSRVYNSKNGVLTGYKIEKV